jgi:hypothetical protein
MRKAYYSRMRNLPLAIPCLIVSAAAAAPLSAQNAPVRAASLESHEGLTISALPWMNASTYREKFPKKSPYSAGILAVQVSFRNDSADSIKVELHKIRLTVHLDAENTQELPPLTADEVADRVFKPSQKDPLQPHPRLPIPVGSPKARRDKNWAELQTQAQNAAVPSGVIAPHSTVQGLLYFDLQNQFDLLDTAHLYVPDLLLMRDNHPLTFFDIDLARTR